jgi:dTDP-4-amino-4,6-dideoxygalactose transaminase
LHLAGVGPGDDVVTTPMTCVATNTPIKARGANVVWADVDPDTGMMDPSTINNALTDKTKAVVFVAWAGNLGEVLRAQSFCASKGIPLILDAAHAFGAKASYGNSNLEESYRVSDIVDYTCYSFQAIKHFTTGDGGALVIRDNDKRARRLRWFGLDRDAAKDEKGDWRGQQWDTDIVEAGYKFNMNNVAAAIGLSQIPHVQSILDAHKRNAHAYDVMFAGQSKILRPLQLSSTNPLWQWKFDSARWVYTIRTPHRDEKKLEIIERLNSFGIKAGLVHVPNDNYTCFASSKVDLPGVREFASTQFSIPCGWWLTDDDVRYIAEKVIDVVYERI